VFGPLRNFIFDLDGTLVNTMGFVYQAFIDLLEQCQSLKVTHEQLRPHMGKAPREIFAVWVHDERALNEIMEAWKSWHQKLQREDVPPYEGIEELLKGLQDKSLPTYIYTGRDRWSAIYILQLHGWWQKYFTEETIYCGDQGFPPKPSPKALLHILDKYALSPGETLFVGDSEKDVQSGLGAGTRTAAALWDMSAFEAKTQRQRFRQAWEKWDKESPDLRLVSPRNLLTYLQTGDFA
jgi:HAD superfamily hydrolase (TIGR01549 family)